MLKALPGGKCGRGHPPFMPTPEQRRAVMLMASVGISQSVMMIALRHDGVTIRNLRTLRRAFADELRHGKELMIGALGRRMFDIAMSPTHAQAFNALCFMLRTWGGPAWRAADPRPMGLSPPDGGTADEPRVVISMPHNFRQPARLPDGKIVPDHTGSRDAYAVVDVIEAEARDDREDVA